MDEDKPQNHHNRNRDLPSASSDCLDHGPSHLELSTVHNTSGHKFSNHSDGPALTIFHNSLSIYCSRRGFVLGHLFYNERLGVRDDGKVVCI
ncbi:hypothetical protein BDFG_00317 [Blastomyces dermatitidis ATCC 26199]|nr:hypothetical protein BDFG_00317 [Blastomyces dermatitidis ATCC 26199]